MADAPDSTQSTAPEPSMEEILASIRKIISDDREAETAPEPATAETGEDILELTQMVQEDGSVVDVSAVAPVIEEPLMPAEIPAVREDFPAPKPVQPEALFAKKDEFVAEPAFKTPSASLVSEPAASAATSGFSALANTVEIERLSSSPLSGTLIGNGSRTLEDMALELMRPLLKQWLDQNLPATVDRLVQKEIERISNRAKD